MRQTYCSYISALNGKEITVIGIGVSNRPLIRMLCQSGARVTARDMHEPIDREEWEFLGVKLCLGENYLQGLGGDIIYRTPGLRPDHPGLEYARACGCTVTSEMNDFFSLCPCPIYGITGSDGKTTTTTLIAEILRADGNTVHLGGNIGTPLLTRVGEISPEDLCVVELSSFQLMDMQYAPHTAVITNISPNHLDWHKDMDEYISAKKKILDFKPSRAVLNRDNAVTSGLSPIAEETLWFGKHMIKNDIINGILPVSEIKLRGWHNVENFMAAMTALNERVSSDSIRKTASYFSGVAHRDELVAKVNGVSYYNDSIGSSPSRTVATLLSHPGRVHLIAGGRDKNVPFDILAERMPKHVKCLYLIGEASEQIEKASRRVTAGMPIVRCENLEQAVSEALKRTSPGDTVLLSPACTSFDQYKNFEERGEHFKRLVKAM
ncbi:MAG: UDP-N-acetylmuramoyl-L-alanine--D-glutamate ligase [Oscillospiraceae bacterium]|nr:UDP-N-acetylmuramoyl-L-alanine--D-glutamate ligase [Oscillospiraceae bacterium]